ncbi:TIR domain-containing protein [Candidatus Palauibacter sp.]|uniref:TIR domain-containing protein n=1 Tax=Candidatus Palauibacter sp. TaxID=3101350 RepID=UPI003B516819
MPCRDPWKPEVEGIIRSCSATICMVGDTTYQSEPVNWEIRKSADLGKLVLAVYLESTAVSIPPALSEIGVTPMRWNVRAIVKELYDRQR